MQTIATNELLRLLPDSIGTFEGTQYPLPVKTTFLGDEAVTITAVREMIDRSKDADVKHLLEPLLLGAELIEAAMPDKERYFITDASARERVFMGSKWMAGWVLVLGDDGKTDLIDKLKQRGFMVFTDCPDIPDTTYIGGRETSPVYFLQLMVRYGLIWGRIAPGDDHQMGHYLEVDTPGFMIIARELPPLKYHIALGLMKLGCPAVVPSSFPFPYGSRIVAEGTNAIIEAGSRFPNLRQRYFKEQAIQLPQYCNRAFAQESFKPAQSFGGTGDSFFCVRKGDVASEPIRVIGDPEKSIGVIVDVAHEVFSSDIADTVEKTAIKAVSYLTGVRGYEKKGSFIIELREGTALDLRQIGESVYWEIRLQYPRIEKLSVTIICDKAVLATEAPVIRRYKEERKAYLAAMTEENTEEFCVCTECRPFSLVHTCILTPDRTPMCASRSFASVKAAALFGASYVPQQRGSDQDVALQTVFRKGRVIDAVRGEYEGANEVYLRTTHGALNRVFLHSVREVPHTSCGCFQTLAFWMEGVHGLGVMLRGSKAVSPDGRTWDMLANSAGGKQTPGIMGVSVAYVRSPQFLRGDGGIRNLRWVDSELMGKIRDVIPEGVKVATEKDVADINELRAFIEKL